MSVRISKDIIDTDKSTRSPLQLINLVSDIPGVLDFVNIIPGNVFSDGQRGDLTILVTKDSVIGLYGRT